MCNRGGATGRGTLQLTEMLRIKLSEGHDIRTNWIGKDFPWCLGVADGGWRQLYRRGGEGACWVARVRSLAIPGLVGGLVGALRAQGEL